MTRSEIIKLKTELLMNPGNVFYLFSVISKFQIFSYLTHLLEWQSQLQDERIPFGIHISPINQCKR